MPILLLASSNAGKVRELSSLFSGFGCDFTTLDAAGIQISLPETADSLAGNAVLKATGYARASGLVAIADDSGLEVDALGGGPGIHSARFAPTDAERIQLLLSRLEGIPWEKRTARFKAVIAIAHPDGKVSLGHGEVEGLIGVAPRGDNGFGYDPVFYVPELGKTFGELTWEEKNRASHRARAARQLYPVLEQLCR